MRAKALGHNINLIEVEAPRIAKKQRPGQFVILRLHEDGERIPLTIEGSDPQRGTITLVVQSIGKTTYLLNSLDEGDHILDIVGPLGKPSEIENYGTSVVIGGSVGTAVALPTARALKLAHNRVVSIIGSRTKDMVILEDEVRSVSDETYVMTDDGSYGEKGLVTDKLKELLASRREVNYVLAVGPVPMMRAVAQVTQPLGIRTMVSLNSIMVDGTGMCGGCRVLVDGTNQFACVDGPEFEASLVNFEVLMQRNNMYREKEKFALSEFLARPEAELQRVRESCKLRALEENSRSDTGYVQ